MYIVLLLIFAESTFNGYLQISEIFTSIGGGFRSSIVFIIEQLIDFSRRRLRLGMRNFEYKKKIIIENYKYKKKNFEEVSIFLVEA